MELDLDTGSLIVDYLNYHDEANIHVISARGGMPYSTDSILRAVMTLQKELDELCDNDEKNVETVVSPDLDEFLSEFKITKEREVC